MSRNLTSVQSLGSKYAIGEVVDMVGVPNFYDAGDSKWMVGNTWFAAADVGVAVAAYLAKSSNNCAMASEYNQLTGEGGWVTVGSVAVRRYNYNASYVLVSTASGRQSVNTGITTASFVEVASNGTFFLAMARQSSGPGATTGIAKSTDGVNWTLQTISWPSSSFGLGATYSYVSSGVDVAGERRQSGVNGQFFWAGARFIAIVSNSSDYRAYSSSDGLSWSDSSNTVLGAPTFPYSNSYPPLVSVSGNNSWIVCGDSTTTASRYSTDGGVTWGTASGVSTGANEMSTPRLQRGPGNETLVHSSSSGWLKVSTNSGQSWTDRYAAYGLTYATCVSISKVSGTTAIVAGYGTVFKKSTDGGATWSLVQLPAGVTGTIANMYSDGVNQYVITSNNEFLVSTDNAATFTMRLAGTGLGETYKAIRVDSNRIVIASNVQSTLLMTNDNGVTWKSGVAAIAASADVHYVSLIPNVGVHISDRSGYSCTITTSDIDNGYGFVRAGGSTPSAIRGGCSPRIRVA